METYLRIWDCELADNLRFSLYTTLTTHYLVTISDNKDRVGVHEYQ